MTTPSGPESSTSAPTPAKTGAVCPIGWLVRALNRVTLFDDRLASAPSCRNGSTEIWSNDLNGFAAEVPGTAIAGGGWQANERAAQAQAVRKSLLKVPLIIIRSGESLLLPDWTLGRWFAPDKRPVT